MGRANWKAGADEPSDGFEPIPAGEYQLKIVTAVMGETKEKGYPMATVDFVVVNSLKYNDKSIKFHRVTFIPEGEPGNGMAKTFLKALGLPYKGENIVIDTDQWIGKVLTASVIIEPYQGKEYNKIKGVKAYEGAPIEEEIAF